MKRPTSIKQNNVLNIHKYEYIQKGLKKLHNEPIINLREDSRFEKVQREMFNFK